MDGLAELATRRRLREKSQQVAVSNLRQAKLRARLHERNCGRQITEHERRGHTDHAEADTAELAIPTRVSERLARVNETVNFNDAPNAWRKSQR